jgi:hypothetical protein
MSPKRSSINARAKHAENRLLRFLTDDNAALRDWKDAWDVQIKSRLDGQIWVVEVKNNSWPAGPGRVWTILSEALDQAMTYGSPACAGFLPKYAEPRDALIMLTLTETGANGAVQWPRVVLSADQFKALYGPFDVVGP